MNYCRTCESSCCPAPLCPLSPLCLAPLRMKRLEKVPFCCPFTHTHTHSQPLTRLFAFHFLQFRELTHVRRGRGGAAYGGGKVSLLSGWISFWGQLIKRTRVTQDRQHSNPLRMRRNAPNIPIIIEGYYINKANGHAPPTPGNSYCL